MTHGYLGFWWEFLGKVGPPIFAAALVACLLAGRLEPIHFILIGAGLLLIWLSHWHAYRSDD